MASWLPVQRWLYTEALAAEDMEEDPVGMGDLGQPEISAEAAAAIRNAAAVAAAPESIRGFLTLPDGQKVSGQQLAATCGKGLLLVGVAGWAAGKFGVLPAAAGAAAAWVVLGALKGGASEAGTR